MFEGSRSGHRRRTAWRFWRRSSRTSTTSTSCCGSASATTWSGELDRRGRRLADGTLRVRLGLADRLPRGPGEDRRADPRPARRRRPHPAARRFRDADGPGGEGQQLVVVQGAPHGLTWTHAEEVNRELLAFQKGNSSRLTSSAWVQVRPCGAPGTTTSLLSLTAWWAGFAEASRGTIRSASPCRKRVGMSILARSLRKSVSQAETHSSVPVGGRRRPRCSSSAGPGRR